MKEEEAKNGIVELKKKSLQQMTQSKEPVYNNQEFYLKEEEKELMVNAPMPVEEVPKVEKENKWNNLEKDIDDSDFEMPENALQCRMKKITKIKGNKRVKTIRRIFKMKDGTEEVHEDVIVDRV